MTTPQVAPYGSWKSPLTSDLIVSGTIRLGLIALDGEDIYWNEGRPSERGRQAIVRQRPDGTREDVNPAPLYARTRVHEYGGGDYVVHNGTVYFANFADQQLYEAAPGREPRPLTHSEGHRYADGVVDAARNRLICVLEDHSGDGEAKNGIVAIDLDSGGETLLASGNDFCANPRLSPDGSTLAWLAWSHPNMPWDGCELRIASLDARGLPGASRVVAGGPTEALFQPQWSPAGVLYFVSDRSGWWNLYRWRDGETEALAPMDAEFGQPLWVFGLSTYGFASEERIICTYNRRGTWTLGSIDTRSGQLTPIDTPFTEIGGLRVTPARVVFAAGSPTRGGAIVSLDLASGAIETIRRASDIEIDPGYVSAPETIEFPTEGGLTAFGFFYPPQNDDFVAPTGELPPLLVMSHGGPTSATSATLSARVQYWTSRGIAVLDVNYGGSTGYGRPYRQRLNGAWGIVDVDDCANGARYLVEQGRVDGNRLAITGGSAGGYTTLCALAFRNTFRAGASHYGIGDLERLALDTHKFESRYMDGLIAPYPERRDVYVERSPIHHLDGFDCPVVFFQGLEDEVVPPNQAETMVDALRAKGVPVAYLPFAGEQHGFRQAENIKRSLDAELYFYSRVFGFELADPVEPLQIDNL
jgi:dipeptidyl aminopeptidase/acylaminoacyl peptidase